MNNDHYRNRIILAVLALCRVVAIYDLPPLLMQMQQHQHPGLSVPLVPIDEDRWA